VVDGEVVLDLDARKARQEALVGLLPERGLVLGAMHDLGPLLGNDTEDLRVEPKAVRQAMGR
jgi:hypothetical protein